MRPLHCHSSRNNSRAAGPWPARSLALALLPLLSLLSPTGCVGSTEQDGISLLKFLQGLSRDSGLSASWRNGTDCCTWKGITCDADGAVTEVSLPSMGLEGRISPALGDMPSLLRLNLSSNTLSGGLPAELLLSRSVVVLDVSFNSLNGDLPELPSKSAGAGQGQQPIQVLNVSSNQFTGQIPSATLAGMNSLVALNASNNSLTGEIPSAICAKTPFLSALDLSFNQLNGSVPVGLGRCSVLRVLKAGHNELHGTLPDELYDATSLEHLSLPNNRLRGALSAERLAELGSLVVLDLAENGLTGSVPDSIGRLERLEELRLEHNSMSGELPSALSRCSSLRTVVLRSNSFHGDLNSVDFSTLPRLKVLDFMQNNFTGTVPESLYSCSDLIALRLSSNSFHGQLSPGIGSLKSLRFLSLTNNSFTNVTNALQALKSAPSLTTLLIGANFRGEAMPEDETIDGYRSLQVLSLADCSLSGEIPRWLSRLENLRELFLSSNRLIGRIPAWVSGLSLLFVLDVSNNSLAGEIPTALADLPMLRSEKTVEVDGGSSNQAFPLPVYMAASLQYHRADYCPKLLNLGGNGLTGAVPPEIGRLKGLTQLNLSFNGLRGEVPDAVGGLTNLQVLDLSSNRLTGEIPRALESLHFLSYSNNDLDGPVPAGGQFCTFPSSSFAGNPGMCGPMLVRRCGGSVVAGRPAPVRSTGLCGGDVVFAVAFGVFLGVGVLYDQMVLSRYFG